MRYRPRPFLRTVTVLAGLLPCAVTAGCSSSRHVELRRWAVAGHTFRAVVDTGVGVLWLTDHMSHVTDPRTYLLVVDLSRPPGAAGRARVFGPLWRSPENT